MTSTVVQSTHLAFRLFIFVTLESISFSTFLFSSLFCSSSFKTSQQQSLKLNIIISFSSGLTVEFKMCYVSPRPINQVRAMLNGKIDALFTFEKLKILFPNSKSFLTQLENVSIAMESDIGTHFARSQNHLKLC